MADRFDVESPQIAYGSTGAAGLRALQQELLRRVQMQEVETARERQARLDAVAEENARVQRLVSQEQMKSMAALRETQQAEKEEATKQKKAVAFALKRKAGDRLSPGAVQEAQAAGLGDLVQSRPVMQGVGGLPAAAAAGAPVPTVGGDVPGVGIVSGLGATPETPATSTESTFLGTPEQQKKQDEDTERKKLLAGDYDTMFASNPKLLQYLKTEAMLSQLGEGKQPPPGLVAPDRATTSAQKDEEMRGLMVKEALGEKLTAAQQAELKVWRGFNPTQDEKNAEARTRQQITIDAGGSRADVRELNAERRDFTNELEKDRVDLQQGLGQMDKVIESIDADTAAAESIVIPQFITALAGGFGSGLRMSDYEIRQVKEGMTLLEQAQAELSRYPLGSDRRRILTVRFKQEMRSLVASIRARAAARYDELLSAKDIVDDAESAREVRGARTGYWRGVKERTEKMNEESSGGKSPAPSSKAAPSTSATPDDYKSYLRKKGGK